ncbi:MAG: hypothetical protein ACXACU_08615 [Candidatus Hodarchaeales archaeon]|jgi:hypothetical protein
MSSNYYRFWLLNHQGLYIFDEKLQRRILMTKEEEDNLIAELFHDPKIEMKKNTTIFSKELPETFTRLYYRRYKSDLYIFLVSELVDITEIGTEFKNWMDLRNLQRTRLKGIAIAIFDDIEGPKVVYNSCLKEENALLLAIQGQTVSGMGRIEEYNTGFQEPLNVPNREDLVHLSYNFLQPAPDSTDPRIQKMGRVSSIYLLFSRTSPYINEDTFRGFVESYIDAWIFDWIVIQEEDRQNGRKTAYQQTIFEELHENLLSTVTTAIDMTTHDKREEAKLKVFIMDLLTQNKVLNSQIRRLKVRIRSLEKELAEK